MDPVTVQEIQDAGRRLSSLSSSVVELLNLLDEVENILTKVEQSSPEPLIEALKPIIEALVGDQLLKNDDKDVRISVASCISQILRITAPDSPYGDDEMKIYFQLCVSAFEKLPSLSGRQYTKAVLILESFAKIRSCIIMLDLELDTEIIKMFRLFFDSVRSQLPPDALFYMERTIITVLEESEELPEEVIKLLLNSLKKENRKAEPLAWELGTNVAKECVTILNKYIQEAVALMNIDLNEYADIVASICQVASGKQNLEVKDIPSEATEPGKASELTSSVTIKDTAPDGNEEDASKAKEKSEKMTGKSEKMASTSEKMTSTSEKITSTSEKMTSKSEKMTSKSEKMTSTSEIVDSICQVSSRKQNLEVKMISTEEHEKASGSISSVATKNTAPNGNEEDASKAKGKSEKATSKSEKMTNKSEQKKSTSETIDTDGEKEPILAVVNEDNPQSNKCLKGESCRKTTKKRKIVSEIIDATEEKSEEMTSQSGKTTSKSEKTTSKPKQMKSTSEKIDTNVEKEPIVAVVNEDNPQSNKCVKGKSCTKTTKKRKIQSNIIDAPEEKSEKMTSKAGQIASTSEKIDTNQEKEPVVEVANEDNPQSVKGESCTKTTKKRKSQCVIIDATKETKTGSESQVIPNKRSRRPNSLIKPDEGYLEISELKRKSKKKGGADIPNGSSSKKTIGRKLEKKTSNLSEEKKGKEKCLRKEESIKNQDGEGQPSNVPEEDGQVTPSVSKLKRNKEGSQQPSISKGKHKIKSTELIQEGPKKTGVVKKRGEKLVGHKIKVWWPEDSVFYPGEITAFDPAVNKYQILYHDGEIEMLDLKKDKWEHVKEEEEIVPAPNTMVKGQSGTVKSESSSGNEMVEVKAYKVKARIAPILEDIMSKHGDIASECPYQSDWIKASLLEIVCDTLQKLHNNNCVPDFDEVQNIIDDAERAKFDIGWLRVELEKRRVSGEKLNGSKMEVAEASKAAQLALEHKKAVLEEAQKKYEEAEKRHKGLLCVLKQIDQDMFENAAVIAAANAASKRRRSKINPY